MKKTIALIILCTLLFGVCGCSTPVKKPILKEITGIEKYKWGMTKKEVKRIIIKDYAYDLEKEKNKELDCLHDDGLLEYETKFVFENGFLSEIEMETKCDKSTYDEYVDDAEMNYERVESDNDLKKTTMDLFESKTTNYNLIYMESFVSSEEGNMTRDYYRR